MGKRTQLLRWGFLLAFLWFGCSAMTIATDETGAAERWRWVITHALATLAGAAFGAAAVTKSNPVP
jgi:hypothetical protein